MSGTDYKCVLTGGVGEITEKKSRFIGQVAPVATEEDAIAFIDEVRRANRTARHNCYAYSVGAVNPAARFSDDGEPSGTAGHPILDVLTGSGLCNTAIVVTRYFGGILLGTGGLVRAYTDAAKAGIEQSIVVTKLFGRRLMIKTDYNGLGKLNHLAPEHGVFIITTDYADDVTATVFAPAKAEEAFCKALLDGTLGKASITPLEFCYGADTGEKICLFEA